MNATSDRFQLSGLSSFWRHSRMGKLAKGLLECPTASPLFAFDELDKATRISGDNVVDVLLSVLEPESAKAFVDEYIGLPVDLSYALFLATANSTQPIPAPILSRLTVIEIPDPSAEQSRVVVRSIAREVIDTCAGPALRGITDQAVTRCVGIDARQVRKILELACPIAVCAKRSRIGAADVDESLALLDGAKRPTMGFLG
jgi:ATP-dependent Lon protease